MLWKTVDLQVLCCFLGKTITTKYTVRRLQWKSSTLHTEFMLSISLQSQHCGITTPNCRKI